MRCTVDGFLVEKRIYALRGSKLCHMLCMTVRSSEKHVPQKRAFQPHNPLEMESYRLEW